MYIFLFLLFPLSIVRRILSFALRRCFLFLSVDYRKIVLLTHTSDSVVLRRFCRSMLVRTRSSLLQVKKHLKRHFNAHTSGVLHFTNCCYGFWYSRSTDCYYYLDPYPCDARGRRTSADSGNACLCVFASVCQMARHMCLNRYEGTTGFFLHRLHVDSIDTPSSSCRRLQEDPMWTYLDYRWRFARSIARRRTKARRRSEACDRRSDPSVGERRFWHDYAIEVAGLIYSVWGTIGAYDRRFGERAGKNRAAVCVAVLAMRHLCHPSRWCSAILDSAVICGDSYYTESLRSAARMCSRPANRFRLLPTFRVCPHSWTVDFGASWCGVLYGDRDGSTLSATLRTALERARNVIVECNGVTLAALAAKDAYYVADPCWIGPPLFAKDRGAIYVLRCGNANALVYAITKMLNTNLRLGVRVTPVSLAFDREDVDIAGPAELGAARGRKIRSRAARRDPGRIQDPVAPIPGAVAVPEGARRPRRDLPRAEDARPLRPENANNAIVSTKWRLNLGKARPLRRAESPWDPVALAARRDSVECVDPATGLFDEARHTPVSLANLMADCDYYPRPIDLAGDTSSGVESFECSSEHASFIRESSRARFRERTADLFRDVYRSYRHRLPRREESARDPAGIDAAREGDGPEAVELDGVTTDATEGTVGEGGDFATSETAESEITDTEGTAQ